MNDGSSQFPVLSSQRDSAQGNLVRWLKFNFVGGIGIAVQLAGLVFFRSVLHLDTLLATALAVETAVIHNFLWHERFTWRDRPVSHLRDSLTRLVKFNGSNGAVSLLGNLAIMRALVGALHMNYVLANLIAVAVCSLANFLLSDQFVFKRADPSPEGTAHFSPALSALGELNQVFKVAEGRARRHLPKLPFEGSAADNSRL